MADLTATYTFDGDEIFAHHEGRVIASGTKMADVEKSALEYLDGLKTTRDQVTKEQAKKKATHIITPNGVKGEIISRVPTVWGETEVTARFEQGRIASFKIHGEDDVQWVTERTASAKDPAAGLEARLASDFERDRASLAARHAELLEIATEAHRLASAGAPYPIEIRLDQIKLAAEAERRQVKEAIDHLDDADVEAYRPPESLVIEQADLGRGGRDSWLDATAQEMIAESEAQDLDKLLAEGPAMFVTDLDTGALADAGVTSEMAFSHVTSKTAGFQGKEVDEFREKFVARVEVARRHELASRKTTSKKEAAADQEVQANVPDEALFS
jgi:hypothetical protein